MVNDFFVGGLNIHSTPGFVGLCFILATIAFLFEGMKLLQAKHKQSELKLRSRQLRTICASEASGLLANNAGTTRPIVTTQMRVCLVASDAGIWLVLHNLGYFLMLTVMLYNGWMFVSILLGSALGYFIFGQVFMKLNLQNCQIIRDTYCMKHCGEPDLSLVNDGESTPVLQQASTSAAGSGDFSPFHGHCHTQSAIVHTEADQ